MPTIAVIGSLVADIVVQTPHIPRSGENLHVPRIQMMTGGKAANTAIAFARLGGQVHLIGNIGDDAFGEQMLKDLAENHVGVSTVGRDQNTATGTGILLVEADGQTAFMIEPGANLTQTVAHADAQLRRLLPTLDGLLINLEAPEDVLLHAAQLAYEHHIPLLVDAGPYRPYSPDLWQHAAILSPNQPETEAIVGYAIESEAALREAALSLLAQGPEAIVLKMGARGSLLATHADIQTFPALDIQPVDSAGAGDAFTAGLAWATLSGKPLPEAIRFANACGAYAASHFGTSVSMPSQKDVAALLQTAA